MLLRALLLSLFFCAASAASPANAQSSKPTAPAPAAEAAPADPSAVSAGGDVVRALVIGSGLLDMMMAPIAARMLPEMRNDLLNSPFYNTLSRRHRDALLAFLDTTPDLLRRELALEVEVIATRSGPRMAQLMSAAELSGIAAFMQSPDARPMFQSLTQRYIESPDNDLAPSDFTDQDIRIMAQFMATPSGIAFYRHSDAINGIIQEEFAASTARMLPRLQASLYDGICRALENECPPELRQQAQPA